MEYEASLILSAGFILYEVALPTVRPGEAQR